MPIQSRQQLKEYCLRNLGAPTIQINVADEQLEDRIDEAIGYFHLYHYDGIERMYMSHQLTEQEKESKTIILPDHVYGVKSVLSFRQGSSSANLFDVQYQLRLNDLYEMTNTSMVYYSMVMQHMRSLDMILNGYPQFEFNKIGNRLTLEINKNKLIPDNYIIIEGYRALDPAQNVKVYDDRWVKEYTTALFKRQWATNLKKYQGMQLPGGVTIDGQSMYIEAQQEIGDLEESLKGKSAPLGFIMG